MDIKIGKRSVGDKYPCFIVADISANHAQSKEITIKTIRAIKESGADAVKLQTYSADGVTLDVHNEYFTIRQGTIWDGRTLYDLYREACMPWEWQPELKKISEDLGLIFFSTPTDKEGIDFLEKMAVPAYKIPSLEISNLELIEYAASKNKPVIISTGVATRLDIEEAITACKKMKNDQIAILKCTSEYPTPLRDVNLLMIQELQNDFKCVVGISDHTLGNSISVASVALGARIIERHFILDKKIGGPDAAFSLEPHEFKEMVKAVREVEEGLGSVSYKLSEEMVKMKGFSRSLFSSADISKGEILTENNVRAVRPGLGLPQKYLRSILGKESKMDIQIGTPLNWDMVE